jgi:hypothetical protein
MSLGMQKPTRTLLSLSLVWTGVKRFSLGIRIVFWSWVFLLTWVVAGNVHTVGYQVASRDGERASPLGTMVACRNHLLLFQHESLGFHWGLASLTVAVGDREHD